MIEELYKNIRIMVDKVQENYVATIQGYGREFTGNGRTIPEAILSGCNRGLKVLKSDSIENAIQWGMSGKTILRNGEIIKTGDDITMMIKQLKEVKKQYSK